VNIKMPFDPAQFKDITQKHSTIEELLEGWNRNPQDPRVRVGIGSFVIPGGDPRVFAGLPDHVIHNYALIAHGSAVRNLKDFVYEPDNKVGIIEGIAGKYNRAEESLEIFANLQAPETGTCPYHDLRDAHKALNFAVQCAQSNNLEGIRNLMISRYNDLREAIEYHAAASPGTLARLFGSSVFPALHRDVVEKVKKPDSDELDKDKFKMYLTYVVNEAPEREKTAIALARLYPHP
jgi:hypothetical protein